MSAADVAAVLVAVSTLAVVALLVVTVYGLRARVRELNEALEDVAARVLPAVEQVAEAAARIDDDVNRAEGLLDTAELVTERADALSRITYSAVTKPAIKTAAVIRGTTRAGQRLRGKKRAD